MRQSKFRIAAIFLCNALTICWVKDVTAQDKVSTDQSEPAVKSPTLAQAEITANTLVPAAGLEQDVAILRFTFEQLHPGLYRYNSKPRMNSLFDQLNADFAHDQTLGQGFLRLSFYKTQIRSGHTDLNPFNQSKSVTAALLTVDTHVRIFRWL